MSVAGMLLINDTPTLFYYSTVKWT